jgi:hypothetical protein
MIGDGFCGEIGGMKIGRGNRSTRRKPAPVPLCPPQTPHAAYTRPGPPRWEVYTVFFFLVGRDWVSWYCGHYWPIVPDPDDRWGWLWRNWWNEDWQGKPKYSEKTCLSGTLSTTNPTWLDPGLNPGRRGGKPATNRLIYGADQIVLLIFIVMKISNPT